MHQSTMTKKNSASEDWVFETIVKHSINIFIVSKSRKNNMEKRRKKVVYSDFMFLENISNNFVRLIQVCANSFHFRN